MDLPKRRPNRLPGYDYSQNGAYFITICTHEREKILCTIVGDGFPVPQLTMAGRITSHYMDLISEKFTTVKVDKSVIMPNHIHLILTIDAEGCGTGNPSPTAGNILGWFKYQTTKEVNNVTNTVGRKLWQRSYHDHIIRTERDYQMIWQYIDTNPLSWELDCFY